MNLDGKKIFFSCFSEKKNVISFCLGGADNYMFEMKEILEC